MQPDSPVRQTPSCPYCNISIASYPRGEDRFHCYACNHDFDIDDQEED